MTVGDEVATLKQIIEKHEVPVTVGCDSPLWSDFIVISNVEEDGCCEVIFEDGSMGRVVFDIPHIDDYKVIEGKSF